MKKMFLASSFAEVAGLFKEFENNLTGKTVAFIPTAGNVEKVIFYIAAGRKALQNLGLTVREQDISAAAPDEIEAVLSACDYIYISGGNTFYLLQELRKSGADRMIISEVNAGKVYIGESAGAIIAAPDIEYARGMDSIKKAPELIGYEGLGLVSFYPLPHVSNPPFAAAAKKIIAAYSASLPLSPFSNSEAIVVIGDNTSITRN